MSCPTNCVSASWPCTWSTRKASLMCILLKSPVRSCTVTSVTRPTSLPGSSVGVSPRACLLNISGARRLYHTFAFHLSLIFRAAARDFFSAMTARRRRVGYLRVPRDPIRSRIRAGPWPSSRAANRLVDVTSGRITPHVHALCPMRSRSANDEHATDLSTDHGELLRHHTIANLSELNQRPSPPSRGLRRHGTRDPTPSRAPQRYLSHRWRACP